MDGAQKYPIFSLQLIQFVFDKYSGCLVEHMDNPNVSNMIRRILTI
jgi:hypothetical protein